MPNTISLRALVAPKWETEEYSFTGNNFYQASILPTNN